MERVLLLPESILALTQVVVVGSILIYLLGRRRKTRSTWMLIVVFCGMTLATCVQDGVLNALRTEFHPVVYWLDSFAGTVIFFGLVNFAHAFHGTMFPRAATLTLWVTGLYVLIACSAVGVLLDLRGGLPASVEMAFEIPNLLMAAWMTAVLQMKKSRIAQRSTDSKAPTLFSVRNLFHAETREESALRAYSWFALALVVVIGAGIWRILGNPSELAVTLFNLSFLPIILALVLIYINHSNEPSTFQVKLVAMSLYTVLALIAVSTMILFPIEKLRSDSTSHLPQVRSVRLLKASSNGYELHSNAPRFDPDRGGQVDVRADSATYLGLDFNFPYFDTLWSGLYVHPGGLVSFGAPYTGRFTDAFYSDSTPKIAALHTVRVDPSAPTATIFLKRDSLRTTITWHGLWQDIDDVASHSASAQLVLHRDGTVDFLTDGTAEYPRSGLRGLHPGGRSFAPNAGGFQSVLTAFPSATDFPHENFGRITELTFRRYAHRSLLPLVYIIFGSTFFVIVIFPLLFRVSLISPLRALLEGVRSVDKGDLETTVAIHSMDEVGILTKGFNEMTQSLAKAEASLKNYAADLERMKDRLHAENVYLQDEIRLDHNFQNIISRSSAFKRVLKQLEQVAVTDATILILGESGTGKELIARAAHNLSPRSLRPLVKVNCAALPRDLIESELFGHEKGAFTGAISRKIGRFELADGGSIFLDEIGELPLELQVKLLRVLQEGEFERLGSAETVRVNVRIIAATNRNLDEEIEHGRFREDLFYRLNVFPIVCPPLRDRKEDVPLLVTHFVAKYSKKIGREIHDIPRAVVDDLERYDWPGNVRELENVIERAVITSSSGKLMLGDWQSTKRKHDSNDRSILTLEELERSHIMKVLDRTNWRVSGESGAAKILGINPKTLQSRMQRLGIVRSSRKS